MPRGYKGPPDPDKGQPHRHTRAKIELMLQDILDDEPALVAVIRTIAKTRPDVVLDALTEVLDQE